MNSRTPKDKFTSFFQLFSEGKSTIQTLDLRMFLSRNGFLDDDIRWTECYDKLIEQDTINEEQFNKMFKEKIFDLLRAKSQDLIIPQFMEFSEQIERIFEECREFRSGNNAQYIPQLARVDSEKYGLSICTVDGQRCQFGDSSEDFCIQSCSKAITYAIALEKLGEDEVHKYVDKEPSGQAFNSMTLTSENLPYNPMINSGAIMICSLIGRTEHPAERFESVMQWFRRLAGGVKIGFSNSVYLSERQTADNNFALAYLMKAKGSFPKDINLIDVLEFYFQCCSIEMNCKSLSILAATLANGGVCPITHERVLSTSTTKSVLSLMHSCGMYNYSGQFAYAVGLPAKSGVSGSIMLVVPGTIGVCIWSPRLDNFGNSVRGVEFCKKLVMNFNFHNFDNISHNDNLSKIDPRKNQKSSKQQLITEFLYACMENDLNSIRRLILSGLDVNVSDYDKRTALHIAASEGLVEITSYLIENGANLNSKDRWDNTPLDDAVRENKLEIVELLRRFSLNIYHDDELHI